MTMKRRVFQILNKSNDNDRARQAFEITIITLIVASVVSIILQSFASLAMRYQSAFDTFEVFTVVVFTLEYALRIWTADMLYPQARHPRLKYMLSFMAWIDLLAILPFYLPFVAVDLRFLRLFRLFRLSRLFRVFKLGRYVDSLQIIGHVIQESAAQLIASVGSCLLIVLVSAILMYGVENAAQPSKFANIADALWWAVCTLTTVGYGDVYPITALGKLMAAVISIMGVGIVAIPTGIISAGFMEVMESRHQGKASAQPEIIDQKHYCPYCGKRLD